MPALRTTPASPVSHADLLTDFASNVFGYLPRSDQRRWANAYLRGLLTVPGRKTIRRIARAVAPSPTAPHALQQFISASPWDWTTARATLAQEAAVQLTGAVWTMGVTVVEKRGDHSVGVHRRFVPGAGRTLNCQVGTGLFLTSESASIPVDWQLLLPHSWSADELRLRRARVPDQATTQPSWITLLDAADRLSTAQSSGRAPLVTDLCIDLDPVRLARQLSARQRDFVIEIRHDQLLADCRDAAEPGGFVAARQMLRQASSRHPHPFAARPDGPGRGATVCSTLVRLPGADPVGHGHRRRYRLLAEVSPGRPHRYWITSLGDDHRIADVLALTRRIPLTHSAVRTLQNDYGLLDFEGRSFPGWHHHMTLATAAYVYEQLQHRALDRAAA
jgi:hypothetical protein